MKVVVLAGGKGTRLWPMSRENFPKQFISINGVFEESPLKATIHRISAICGPRDIFIVTAKPYKHLVESQLEEIGIMANLVVEPEPKSTAPAIILAVKHMIDSGSSLDETVLVVPSDHLIKPVEGFISSVKKALKVAENGYIVTFGVKPRRPDTGYGYIEKGIELSEMVYKIKRFCEKPDFDTAVSYVNSGSFYWNSGMFLFSIGTLLEEVNKNIPQIYEEIDKSIKQFTNSYYDFPEISFDYAIMEKTEKGVVVEFEADWHDIGSWDSIYEISQKDEKGNVISTKGIFIDTRNSFFLSKKKVIATAGIENTILIETEDAIFLSKRGKTQEVKKIVSDLKEDKELSHLVTSAEKTYKPICVERPWGKYIVLEKGENYQIKRIVVNPGHKLSLQVHQHRSEHWIIVKGIGKVTIDDMEFIVQESESPYIPPASIHRIENIGKIPLEIIEVQTGKYLGEDDIIRLADDYGRTKKES